MKKRLKVFSDVFCAQNRTTIDGKYKAFQRMSIWLMSQLKLKMALPSIRRTDMEGKLG